MTFTIVFNAICNMVFYGTRGLYGMNRFKVRNRSPVETPVITVVTLPFPYNET